MKLQKIGPGIFAIVFVASIGLFSATTIQAQGVYRRDRYEQQQRERERQRQWEREQRRNQRRSDRGYGNNGRYNSGRYNDGYPDLGGSFQLRETALNAGANEGTKEGRKDRSRGDRFDFSDEGAFQSATKDYSSRLGDRETYRRYFRMAFESAYRDAYAGY